MCEESPSTCIKYKTWSESITGNLSKLELKYFEIQMFHVTAMVLVFGMYGCYELFKKYYTSNRSDSLPRNLP